MSRSGAIAAGLVLLALSSAALAGALNWHRITGGSPATRTGLASIGGHEVIVPNGWVPRHWSVSPDGTYAVVKTSGSARAGGDELTGKTAVGVYRVDRDGLVEVARTLATGVDISTSGDLSADSSGMRTIRLETGSVGSTGAPPTIADLATIAIDASGSVTTSLPSAPSPACLGALAPTPFPAPPADACPSDTNIDDKRIDDPLAPITVIPTPPVAFSQPPFVTPSCDACVVVAEPTALPQVSVPAGVAPTGWRVSDAIWSPDGKYLAVTTHGVAVKPRSPIVGGTATFVDDQTQLSVYSVQGHQLRELWREVNWFVEIDHDLAFRDIEGDGAPEVVYYTSDGSNGHLRTATLALRIKDERTAIDVPLQLPIPQSVPEKPVDLEGDGKFEWIALDASWQGAGPFSHADEPDSSFVLAWDGHAYVDATSKFADAILQGPDPVPPPADASCLDVTEQRQGSPGVRPYLSRAVSRFLDYLNAGRSRDAQRILNDLRTARLGPAASEVRDAIVEALIQDPHLPSVRAVQGCKRALAP